MAAAPGLADPAFRPLPLGAVRPSGWLQRQLRIQADGLSGHLDEFWPDVANSKWFGGDAEGWERAPYWLDGAIPLAWLLDDEAMKARIRKYVDHIVTAPARGRVVQPIPRGRGLEAVRHVGHPARQQGPRAVPRAHRGRPRPGGGQEEPAGDARRPRPHAALRVGQVPVVRGAGAGLLRLRADARTLAARPGTQAARPGRGLRGPLLHRGRHHPDPPPGPLEVDEARGQHRDGHQGRRARVAARPAARGPRVRHRG